MMLTSTDKWLWEGHDFSRAVHGWMGWALAPQVCGSQKVATQWERWRTK